MATCHMSLLGGAGSLALGDDADEGCDDADDLKSTFATQLQRALDVDVPSVLRAARDVAESPVSQLRPGAKVRLIGLVSRPELNGQSGMVAVNCAQNKGSAVAVASEQRWGVTLLSGDTVSVKISNMVTRRPGF